MTTKWLQSQAVSIRDLLQQAVHSVNAFVSWWSGRDHSKRVQERCSSVSEDPTSSNASLDAKKKEDLLRELLHESQQSDTFFCSIDACLFARDGKSITEVLISAWARDRNTIVKVHHFLIPSDNDTTFATSGVGPELQSTPSHIMLSHESELIEHAQGIVEHYRLRYSQFYLLIDGSRIGTYVSRSLMDIPGKERTVRADHLRNPSSKKLELVNDAIEGEHSHQVSFGLLLAMSRTYYTE